MPLFLPKFWEGYLIILRSDDDGKKYAARRIAKYYTATANALYV